MVENPVSIHKEDLEEPQVKVSRPNRPSPSGQGILEQDGQAATSGGMEAF